MASEPRAPHGQMFRALVPELESGARLVRQLLPPAVANLIADAPLVRVPETFVDENLGLRQADALFEAKLEDGRPALLYVLLEHKSWPDPWARLPPARQSRLHLLPQIVVCPSVRRPHEPVGSICQQNCAKFVASGVSVP